MQQLHGGGAGAIGGAPAQGPEGGGDIADQLEQLNRLKSQGALSDEEFEKAKKKLLDA
ncbi:MAG: SHOCT domain-containing protein [Solirubrobacterales bacterium]|nr:SHOCT domain-containing protein [Solirubrobacterales bacterium]